jgi:5,5'-dehydrodivanillate O-demethylase
MLSEDDNVRLTRVGADTAMGRLLRRYWWPIAAASELDARATKAVRILGEDLVLYRDLRGVHGLVARHCLHRRANLVFGIPEKCGLRCPYHGWLYHGTGAVVERPFEDTVNQESSFGSRHKLTAYRVEEKAGVLFAYLGPEPAPCLWDWDFFYTRGYREIITAVVPCNWLQCQENAIDPVHFEWLHLNWTNVQRGVREYSPKHLRLKFEEFEHGFIYRRVTEDSGEEDDLWSVGRVCLWPNGLFAGAFDWSVPIDDDHTLRMFWVVHPVPGDRPIVQERIPHWRAPTEDPDTGRWFTFGRVNQDFTIAASQGRILDRTQEHLGQSDRGIVMVRERFFADLHAVAQGGDPKNIIRDAARNVRLRLPITHQRFREGVPPVMFEAQPPEVLEDLRRVLREHAPN